MEKFGFSKIRLHCTQTRETTKKKISNNKLKFSVAEGDDAVVMPSEDEKQPDEVGERAGRASRGCGLSARDQYRVTGGQDSGSRDWPWVAMLMRAGEQFCGGVLITDRHVLTAAHCVHRFVLIPFHYGSWNKEKKKKIPDSME